MSGSLRNELRFRCLRVKVDGEFSVPCILSFTVCVREPEHRYGTDIQGDPKK